MQVLSWHADPVTDPITGEQLAAARSRARLTQKQLAHLTGHSERAIQAWERVGVAAGKEPLVRSILGEYLEEPGETHAPLSSYSNWSLLMEIGRRLEENGGSSNATDTKKPLVGPNRPSKVSEVSKGPRFTGRSGGPPGQRPPSPSGHDAGDSDQ